MGQKFLWVRGKIEKERGLQISDSVTPLVF